MPPIPLKQVTFSDPEITVAIGSLEQREAYLAKSVIQHIASLPPNTQLIEQQRLAEELREDLEDFGKRVEALEQLVEDLDTQRERAVGREVVQLWADTFARLRKDARGAILSSKKAIDMHAKSRRDELIGTAVFNGNEKREDEKTDDALMRTTANLTEALRRTEARLKAELDRSMLSTQLLTSQTATLRQTSNAHGQLTNLLDTSKNLVTALERTDWLDKMLILGALLVFVLTCAYIVKVRIFDKAVRVAFWWVRFMPSFGEDRILDELEKGARTVTDTITSLTASASSTLSSILETPTITSSVVETISTLLEDTALTTASEASSVIDLTSTYTSDTLHAITSLASSAASTATSIFKDEL